MPDALDRLKELVAQQDGFSLQDGLLSYSDVEDWLVEISFLPMAAD